MVRGVFWISVKMRFVRMVVFRGQGAHFKRQQVADVVISQAGAWPGHGQIRKKRFFVENMSLAWAEAIFRAIICWGLRICAGWRPATLTQSPDWATQKNPDFERNWRHPKSFSLKKCLELHKKDLNLVKNFAEKMCKEKQKKSCKIYKMIDKLDFTKITYNDNMKILKLIRKGM